MAKLEIKKGEKFGYLKIIKELPRKRKPSGQTYRRFLCECDCGETTKVTLFKITSGHTKSCGCYGKSVMVKHGMSKTSIYNAWSHMKQRCDKANVKRYKHYGGRGITYDPRWKEFENFYEDMKGGYKKGLFLDRINNDGNYQKENCRWVSMKESANNTSRNKKITLNGITKNVRQWEEERGLNRNTIYARLKRGWSIGRAINTPLRINQYN